MTFKERRKSLGFKTVKEVALVLNTSVRTVEKWDGGVVPAPGIADAFFDLYEKHLKIQELTGATNE